MPIVVMGVITDVQDRTVTTQKGDLKFREYFVASGQTTVKCVQSVNNPNDPVFAGIGNMIGFIGYWRSNGQYQDFRILERVTLDQYKAWAKIFPDKVA